MLHDLLRALSEIYRQYTSSSLFFSHPPFVRALLEGGKLLSRVLVVECEPLGFNQVSGVWRVVSAISDRLACFVTRLHNAALRPTFRNGMQPVVGCHYMLQPAATRTVLDISGSSDLGCIDD